MPLILPAVETAQELQRSVHDYLKRFDNPLIQQHALALDATNRQELLYRQAEVLTSRLQYFRFCLTRLTERGLGGPDSDRQKLVDSLWDETERYGNQQPYQIRQFNPALLEQYINDISATIKRLSEHVRVKGTDLRRMGELPEIPLDPVVLTESQCREIVRAITEDLLNAKLLWQPKTAEDHAITHSVMQKFFPQWDARDEEHASHLPPEHAVVWREQAIKASDHFFHKVLSPISRKLSHLINTAIPDETWAAWSLRDVGHDLVLMEGQDWRILDWNRRMQSGEWSMPETGTSETVHPEYQQVKVRTDEILAISERRDRMLKSLGLDASLFTSVAPAPAPEVFKVARTANRGKRDRV